MARAKARARACETRCGVRRGHERISAEVDIEHGALSPLEHHARSRIAQLLQLERDINDERFDALGHRKM